MFCATCHAVFLENCVTWSHMIDCVLFNTCSSTSTTFYTNHVSLLIEYREAFKCFDLNENGTLSTKELKYAMRMLGSNPTDSQVQELVNAKDFDGKRLVPSFTHPCSFMNNWKKFSNPIGYQQALFEHLLGSIWIMDCIKRGWSKRKILPYMGLFQWYVFEIYF